MRRILIIFFLLLFSGISVNAQRIGVKTNALYLATSTPNIGLEYAFADRFSLELEGGYNPWTLDSDRNMKAKHFLVSPEVRYWFCEAFNGHFIGINANYTLFNLSGVDVPAVFFPSARSAMVLEDLKNRRSEGWAAGAGLTYGCVWPIARRWNLECTVGLGYWYTDYDKFESRKCGLFQEHVSHGAFGPTALGISFIYLIR
ncbi:MAG: DUF3575 domain-containing protein [Bacteroidales bacterium]|jgi:hypothetical protein|nr:DUF3575 domain-containing protein [Bacteroidales bacterium]